MQDVPSASRVDSLAMQHPYRTVYGPPATVSFFERLRARQKEQTGFIAAAFRTHPPSGKRVVLSPRAVDELLPDRPSCAVSASEFDPVKASFREAYRGSKEGPDNRYQPETLRRASDTDGASKGSQK